MVNAPKLLEYFMREGLKQLYQDQLLCDATIVAEGKRFPCHSQNEVREVQSDWEHCLDVQMWQKKLDSKDGPFDSRALRQGMYNECIVCVCGSVQVPLTVECCFADAVPMNNGIYVIGDYSKERMRHLPVRSPSPGIICGSALCFFISEDDRMDEDVFVPQMPRGIAGAGVVQWERRIYVLGGENCWVYTNPNVLNESPDTYYDTIYFWEPSDLTWTECPENLPIVDDGNFLVACLHGLKQLYQDHQLCDATIVAEGKRFPCHRMLLAAVNPYFRAMFVSSFKESQDGEVLLQDMAPSTVQTILQYLYTEKISVTSETAQAVFIAASRLQILPLLEICSRSRVRHRNERWPDSGNLHCTRKCFFLGEDGKVNKDVVIPKLPVEIAGAGVVRWKRRIYVLGGENTYLYNNHDGENEEEYYNTIYYWEPGDHRWTQCPERLPFSNWGISGFGCATLKLPKKTILSLFRKTSVALTAVELADS
ncbi:Kelch repeat and BTB domain-containing protein 5 [Chelonia mydas]|uniref:Kelch repeat and BTB domain-containing protein 5 n=1 Tax=Chelonia mydas TaxID=8469 RepID=M7CLM4_CHEMY|nr:Kelch repeat and BTB domain-containing protein 5 [Chelonia mydas]